MRMRKRDIRWQEMDKRNTPFTHLIDDFLLAKRSAGCSEKTISWYRANILIYLRFLEGEGHPPLLRSFSADSVRRYTVYLQERRVKFENNPLRRTEGRLSSQSIFGYVATLGVFATWLAAEGYTRDNLLRGVPRPRKRKTAVSGLSREEIERLLSRVPKHTLAGTRDRAILLTLLDCGLRASELCDLTLKEAHLEEGYLKVLGKGNKERIVPVGVAACRAILRYRDFFRRDQGRPVPNLFLSIQGERLKPNALRYMVQRRAKSVEIKDVTVHKLRHTFALQYLMAGGDAFSLQKILGHTTMDMTRNYVNILPAQLVEKHRLHSPMDRMTIGFPSTKGRADGRDECGRFAASLPHRRQNNREKAPVRRPNGPRKDARPIVYRRSRRRRRLPERFSGG